MEIKYLNHSSFLIKTKTATIVMDPFSNSSGIKFSKISADIVTVSHAHEDHSNVGAIEGSPIVFDWPGEFEYKGVAIKGIASYHDDENGAKRGNNILYKISSEGIQILHCGDLGHSLDDKTLEMIGAVDILCVPVGGNYTLDPQAATQLVKKIDPTIAIPMHFANPELDAKTFVDLQPVQDFLKLMGQTDVARVPKLVVKHDDFLSETSTKVALLEPTN